MYKNIFLLVFNQFAGCLCFFAICLSRNVLDLLTVKVRDGKNFCFWNSVQLKATPGSKAEMWSLFREFAELKARVWGFGSGLATSSLLSFYPLNKQHERDFYKSREMISH